MRHTAQADEVEARALAVALAGPAGADALLAEAKRQVRAICGQPEFRRQVDVLARELLRRRRLNADDTRTRRPR